ncbi:MAG: alpha/beta hydrolase [Acetobacteraceae bacterium]|nr:alpha/beta hydrolase [Acetobacteraceae bacterium]
MSNPEIDALRAAIAARPKAADIAEMRRGIDSRGLANPLAEDVAVTVVNAAGVKAEWTATPNAIATRAILYLHGGGYVIGSLDSHRHAAAEMGRAAAARVLALEYRLAPEHPFPAPVEDTLAGYRYLLAQGFAPGQIALAGDSAGGGLVVAAMLAIRDAGLPQPACGWAISPWIDMESTGTSITGKSAEDPGVQKAGLDFMATTYLAGADPKNPLASPLHANLAGLAPLLIQVGAAETLLDDATRLAALAGAAHVAVTLEIWPEMIHVWHVYHPILAAGRHAISNGGTFVRATMDGANPVSPRVP